MLYETISLTAGGRVNLTAYLHAASPELPNWHTRPGVLVLPGGGYTFTSDREAEPIALAFLAQGLHAFVLRYSVGEYAAFPNALCDASRAIQAIRARSAAWNLDPDRIAVCGFSAGGHLAASLGTLWNDPEIVQASGVPAGANRPNALILAYPVITAGPHAHAGSIENLCAGRSLQEMAGRLSCERNVGAHTPPTFLFHTYLDNAVPVENALLFADALARADVPFELHIFQNGVHGLALANHVTSSGLAPMLDAAAQPWFGMCVTWLWGVFGRSQSNGALPWPAPAGRAK